MKCSNCSLNISDSDVELNEGFCPECGHPLLLNEPDYFDENESDDFNDDVDDGFSDEDDELSAFFEGLDYDDDYDPDFDDEEFDDEEEDDF